MNNLKKYIQEKFLIDDNININKYECSDKDAKKLENIFKSYWTNLHNYNKDTTLTLNYFKTKLEDEYNTCKSFENIYKDDKEHYSWYSWKTIINMLLQVFRKNDIKELNKTYSDNDILTACYKKYDEIIKQI